MWAVHVDRQGRRSRYITPTPPRASGELKKRKKLFRRGWSATTLPHPRGYGYYVDIRLDTGVLRGGHYRPPMNPAEIISRLRDACTTMGVPGGADSWRDGDVIRVDYTWDQLLLNSPDPGKLPGYKTRYAYPGGNALYLSGTRRPAPRAVTIYNKTRHLLPREGELNVWRTEYRWSTPAACRRIGIVGVEDALCGLLLFAALVGAGTTRARMGAVMGRAMRDLIRDCRTVQDVRRRTARIRAQGRTRKPLGRITPVYCRIRGGKIMPSSGVGGDMEGVMINIGDGIISAFFRIFACRAPP